MGTFVAYIPSAPPDGDQADTAAEHQPDGNGKSYPQPPEPIVEECEVPLSAEEADSDAGSDTSTDALRQCAALYLLQGLGHGLNPAICLYRNSCRGFVKVLTMRLAGRVRCTIGCDCRFDDEIDALPYADPGEDAQHTEDSEDDFLADMETPRPTGAQYGDGRDGMDIDETQTSK